jgi:hypothetical protein
MTFHRAIPSNEPPDLSLGELELDKPCSDPHGFRNWNSGPGETQRPHQRFLGTAGDPLHARVTLEGRRILSTNLLDRTVVIRTKHIFRITVSGHASTFEQQRLIAKSFND